MKLNHSLERIQTSKHALSVLAVEVIGLTQSYLKVGNNCNDYTRKCTRFMRAWKTAMFEFNNIDKIEVEKKIKINPRIVV